MMVLSCIANKTGYSPEELELDYELEADLGIDTVKQAEIFSELREDLNIDPEIEVQLAEVPTIEALYHSVETSCANSASPPPFWPSAEFEKLRCDAVPEIVSAAF